MMIKHFRTVTHTEQIKIVTINTWKCDGEYRKRIQVMVKQLADLKPDIIACQECFVSETADTLHYLSDCLKMNYCYLPGRRKMRLFEGKETDSESGLGVLSLYPLIETGQFNLPVV